MLIPTPTLVNIEHGAAVLKRAFHKNTGHYKPVIHAHTLTYKSADDRIATDVLVICRHNVGGMHTQMLKYAC